MGRCKRVMGMFLVVCMLASALGMTAFAAYNQAGTKRLVADFEDVTTAAEAASAYGVSPTVKVNAAGGAWESVAEVTAAEDALGGSGKALHFYWDTPQTVSTTNAGTDAMWSVTCLDYSGDAVTGFDFKLDNDISRLRLNDRYLNAESKAASIDLASLSTSSVTLWGQPVGVSLTAGEWYHLSLASSYDAAKNAILASAWLDGVQVVSSAEIPYTLGADKINGSTDNMLRFVCDYNTAATAEAKPGYWVDNIVFDQMGSGEVVTNPKNDEIVSDPNVTFTFPADIDPTTLDTSAITVHKDGAALSPAAAELRYNRLRLTLSEGDSLENADYTVTLPAGIKDILGYELPESARTLSFSGYNGSAVTGAVSVTAPVKDSYLTYGKPIVVTASAAAGASVSFFADETQIGTATADDQGIASVTWTPDRYGDLFLTASAQEGESVPMSVKVVKATENRHFSAAASTKITDGSAPVDANHTEVYKLGSGGNFGPNDLNVTSGVWEFAFDIYTDENGSGANFSSVLYSKQKPSTGTWRTYLKMSEKTMSFLNSSVTATYKPSTWYNIRIVVDMDTLTYTVLVDGAQIVSNVDFSIPNDPITRLFRIKVENVPATATVCYSPVYLYSLEEVNTNVGAAITSPADSAVIEKGQPITLTATAASGDGNTVADSLAFYQDGAKLGDATKQADGTFAYLWTPTTSGSTTLSALAVSGGKTYPAEEITVKVLGDAARSWDKKTVYIEGSTVTKSDGTAITETTFNLASEEALTLTNDGTNPPYTQSVQINKTSGYVVIEADVILPTGAGLRIYNRPNGANNAQNVVLLEDGKVFYYAANNGTGASMDSGVTYESGQPVHVKALWNLEKKRIDIYINGVRLAQQTVVRDDYLNVNGVRFTPNKKGDSITVQNETIRYILTEPKVSAVAVKNAAGVELNPLTMQAGSIASIEAAYSLALDESTVNTANVKLYRGSGTDAEVPATVTLLADGKTVSVKPDASALVPAAEYRLVLSGEIAAKEGGKAGSDTSYSFRTVLEGKGVANGAFAKGSDSLNDNGLSGVQKGDTVTFTADLTSTVAEKDVWVVLALHGVDANGDKGLKDVSITRVNMNSVQQAVTGSLTLSCDVASGDILSGYVWNGALVPFGDEFHINR